MDRVDLRGELVSSRLQEEFRQAEAAFKRGTSSHMYWCVCVINVSYCTDMNLPISEWPEIQALSTYEWIQR